jgi:hypothetical protein
MQVQLWGLFTSTHVKEAGLANSTYPSVPTTALQHLQDRFAIIDLSGEIRLVDRHQIADVLSGSHKGEVSFYKKADAELLMKRALERLPVASKPNDVVKDFWVSPNTLQYEATAFSPLTTPPTTLNFWVGPIVQPAPGCWVLLRDYLHDVICDGNSEVFEYLVQYMAHMIQKPEEKPGVMVVLLGGQGTGKGVYFTLLRAIWPKTTLLISDVDQVLGKFNAVLERNFMVCMDEALFAGDRRAIDRLKSMVSETFIHIEQKYQPSRSIESVHRFFAASNHEHFANVERDDRRFLFLRLSAARQQDTAYFSTVIAAIKDPDTLNALAYYLKNVDLSGYDVRAKPKTEEQAAQKIRSLQGFERFWYEVLSTADLDGGRNGSDTWTTEVFISTSSLMSSYREFDKNAQRHHTLQEAQVADKISRICPSAKRRRETVRSFHPVQHRGLRLPAIKTARDEFSAYLGCAINWDEEDQ